MTERLLEGRTALLTGVGSGLGRGIATSFAAAGANVALVARSNAVPDALVREVRGAGGTAAFMRGDITDPASLATAVHNTIGAFGGIDIVVQIAAHGRSHLSRPLDDITLDEWDEHVAVTLTGCYNVAHAAYPALKASGRGRFIAITSAYGLAGDASNPIYASLKGAIRGFAKSLAKEWGDDGIAVNIFSTSSESESSTAYFEMHPEAWEGFRAAFPMRRMGNPEIDIAPAIVALAGEQFRFVSGQTIPIDGGFYTTL